MEILVIIRLCCNCTYGEGWRGLWCGGSVSPAAGPTSLRDGGGFVLCSLKLGASLFWAVDPPGSGSVATRSHGPWGSCWWRRWGESCSRGLCAEIVRRKGPPFPRWML